MKVMHITLRKLYFSPPLVQILSYVPCPHAVMHEFKYQSEIYSTKHSSHDFTVYKIISRFISNLNLNFS